MKYKRNNFHLFVYFCPQCVCRTVHANDLSFTLNLLYGRRSSMWRLKLIARSLAPLGKWFIKILIIINGHDYIVEFRRYISLRSPFRILCVKWHFVRLYGIFSMCVFIACLDSRIVTSALRKIFSNEHFSSIYVDIYTFIACPTKSTRIDTFSVSLTNRENSRPSQKWMIKSTPHTSACVCVSRLTVDKHKSNVVYVLTYEWMVGYWINNNYFVHCTLELGSGVRVCGLTLILCATFTWTHDIPKRKSKIDALRYIRRRRRRSRRRRRRGRRWQRRRNRRRRRTMSSVLICIAANMKVFTS